MPRTLPWLVDTAKRKSTKKETSSSSPAPKHTRESSPEDLVDLDLNALAPSPPKPKSKKPAARTPSTSPPPAPPDIEYMQEGYNADDIYMMVEDEFLSTAKTFTQHLHHAEYVKFKKLAKARGKDVVEAIQRPVDGRTAQSKGLRLQLEAEERAKKIRKAVMDGDESSGEDEYMQDPQLAGLMQGVGGTRKDLSGMAKAASNTRAAAGFEQSPTNVERVRDVLADSREVEMESLPGKARKVVKEELYSDEEDNLDVSRSRTKTSSFVKPEKRAGVFSEYAREKSGANEDTEIRGSGIFKQYGRDEVEHRSKTRYVKDETSPISGPRETKPEKPPSHDTFSPSKRSAAASEYLAKRRANRERKEQDSKQKAKTAFDIPTFAI